MTVHVSSRTFQINGYRKQGQHALLSGLLAMGIHWNSISSMVM